MEKPSESSPLKDFCKNEIRNMRERHKKKEEEEAGREGRGGGEIFGEVARII